MFYFCCSGSEKQEGEGGWLFLRSVSSLFPPLAHRRSAIDPNSRQWRVELRNEDSHLGALESEVSLGCA
jgi:hypothetical protein